MIALDEYRLILVRPMFAGNLGAIARVTANFNLKDVAMIDNFASVVDSEAHRYATNTGRDYLKEFKSFKEIPQALDGLHYVVGFTARDGATRSQTVTLEQLSSLANPQQRLGLMFGNEQDGLTTTELSHCTHVCHIPTSELHRAMNLSHAVAIAIGFLFNEKTQISKEHTPKDGISHEELKKLMEVWKPYAKQHPFYKKEPERALTQLMRVFARAELTKREADLIDVMLRPVIESAE